MEARVLELERRVARVRERIAKLETLEPTIRELKTSVDELAAVMNKGKGAIWIIGGLGVAVGSLVHVVWEFIGRTR
jgi:hypothetical protein